LQFAQRLLRGPVGQRSPDELLAEFAGAFGTQGAGLAGVMDPPPAEWPDQVTAAAALPAGCLIGTSADREWLMCRLADGRLLWLSAARPRRWTAAEGAALALCGRLLGELVPADSGPDLNTAVVLAGRLGHAFGNVLTGILGFAELAAGQVPAASPLGRQLAAILQAAQQGVELTQQLSQFAGARAAQPGRATLDPLLHEECQHWRERSTGAAVAWRVSVAPGLPPAAIPVEPLRLALGELLRNAVEAQPGGGSIGVQARPSRTVAGSGVEVCVANGGPVLDAGNLRRLVTEPFYSTKPRHRGLGLALVRQIAHCYGGAFRLEPGAEGGAVAHLWLPLAVLAEPPAHGDTAHESHPD
jgi:signal transduction histidine kinase